MKTMKIFFAALALLAMASCVKEQPLAPETVEGEGASFTASRTSFTKTQLVDGHKVEWKADNQILVFGKEIGDDKDDKATGSETFDTEPWKSAKWFKTSTGGSSVRFVCSDATFQFDPNNEYIMLHPAGGNYYGLCTDDAKYMRFWLSDQTPTLGTYQEAYGYCAAKASDFTQPVRFKNLLPLLKFTVPASLDGRINKITVTSNNPTEDGYVAGNMICDYTGNTPVVKVFSEFKSEYAYKKGNSSVALKFTKKEGDKTVEDKTVGMTKGDYYLAIAPKTYSKGITITVRYTDETTSTRSSSAEVNLESGVIYDMGTVGAENYDGYGATLPYVFSLFATNGSSNSSFKYMSKNVVTNNTLVQWKDKDTEAVLEAKSTGTKCDFWANKWIGHDNLICQYFNNKDTYFMLSVPLRCTLPAKFRVTFGHFTEPAHNIIKDWKLQYSKDKETWYDGATYQYERILKYYSLELTPEVTFNAGETLYLRWMPYGDASWAGGTTTGQGAQVQLTSGVVITDVTSPDSNATGNVYAEDFDRINGGVDFRHAGQTNGIEKLGLLGEVFGDSIENWTAEQKNGLSGSYAAERPGYVQIGYATYANNNRNGTGTNHVGSLVTPALEKASGTITLSFKAMCYRSPFTGRDGMGAAAQADVTDIVVKIKGAGSFDSASSVTSKTLSEISTSKFELKTLHIYNSDATTQIEFTSPTGTGKFTRWFIDDICVSK